MDAVVLRATSKSERGAGKNENDFYCYSTCNMPQTTTLMTVPFLVFRQNILVYLCNITRSSAMDSCE
jgi:hypothetical protein